MTNKLALLLLLACTCTAQISAQWDSIQLPCRPFITELHTWQNTIYAAASDGNVFRYNNGNSIWKNFAKGYARAVSPTDGRIAITDNDANGQPILRIFRNDGQEIYWGWIPSISAYARSFLIYDGADLYVASSSPSMLQRLRLLQGTWSWTTVSTPLDFYINQCVVRGQHVWLSGSVLAHSADLGDSWDTIPLPTWSNHLAISGDTLLVHYQDSLQQTPMLTRTNDQGQTWTTVSAPFGITEIRADHPFVGINRNTGKSYFSWNGLTDWQEIDTDFTSAYKIVNGVPYAGLASGIQIKQNGLWKWVDMGYGKPFSNQILLRRTGNNLLFGNDGTGISMYERVGNAQAWTQDNQPYFPSQMVQVGNQLVGCGRYGTYLATAGAADVQWQLLNSKTGRLDVSNNQLYLTDWNDGTIYRSTDVGQTWTSTGISPGVDIQSGYAIDAGNFYYRQGAQLLVSQNEGQTWTPHGTIPFGSNPQMLSRMFAFDGRMFLSDVYNQKIHFSTDNGLTFNTLAGVPQQQNLTAFRLRVFNNDLYLYIGDKKLYRSLDYGQTWKTTKAPYPGFDFEPSIAESAMFANDTKMYLYDPSQGVAWAANVNELEPSPCDDIVINMLPKGCTYADYEGWINLNVSGTFPGLQYTWFKDGTIIQQNSIDAYPNFNPIPPGNTSTYVLRINDPASGCSVSDTIQFVPPPVADFGLPSVYEMPCNVASVPLNLSLSTALPGIQYRVIFIFPPYGEYYNEILPDGTLANPIGLDLSTEIYQLQVYDPESGCYAIDTVYISRDQDETIADYATLWANCGQNNGIAQLYNNNDPNITYAWSNGATTQTVTGLAPGWYSVTVTNDFCYSIQNIEIQENPVCKVKIRGNIWNNTVCNNTWPAQPAPQIMLHLLPDDVFTFSDNQGNYEFAANPGAHTIGFADNLLYELLCPASGSISVNLPNFGDVSIGNDFFVQAKPIKNLVVGISASPTVRGTTTSVTFSVCNKGNQPIENVVFQYQHDPTLGSLPLQQVFNAYDPATHTATLNIGTLWPGQCWNNSFAFDVPESIPLGTVLQFSAMVLPVDDDFFPVDNQQEWSRTVVAAFDPNDKQVSPGDTEYGGKIFEKDSLLRYTVRFQNTGNYPATTVEIRDTLDSNLDVTSIQLIGTSHSYPLQMRFEEQNVLIFRFNDINLPDSMTSQSMSQGYVSFSILRKKDLPSGTVIRNRAGIYFDYNSPIITNWTESVLSPPVGVRPDLQTVIKVRLFPNPNYGAFSIELPEPATPDLRFRVVDLTGRITHEQAAQSGHAQQTIQSSHLPAGLYFLQVVSEGRILTTEKFVKE